MAQTKRPSAAEDQELIDVTIDLEWDRYAYGRADARTREGVPVWALIAFQRGTGYDRDQLAQAYNLSSEVVDAACGYYRQNKKYIDARIRLTVG
jgi:hypothetical protein